MDQPTNQAESFTENEVSRKLWEAGLVENVFGIELISEKILKLLIFDKNKKIDRKMVQTLRHVQKLWLKTTSRILRISGVTIIVLNGGGTNSRMNNVKRFTDIVRTLSSPKRVPISLLPLKLVLTTTFFREENHKKLIKCLTHLGKELVEIIVSFPRDGGTMSMLFPKFTLPILREISFKFSEGCSQGSWYSPVLNNKNGLLLLQKILNASENLRDIIFLNTFDDAELPKNFANLNIPESLSSVQIKDKMKAEYLEVFSNNPLPSLKHLTLNMSTTPMESDIMFKILERFRCTLISLEVNKPHNSPSTRMILKFPRLEMLEKLQITGIEYELEPQSCSDLQKLFPSLKHVGLIKQTEATLANWVGSSKFHLVESLNFSVMNEEEERCCIFKSASLVKTIQVHKAFPRVRTLEITVNNNDMSSLTYLFQSMQLKSLRINVWADPLNPHKWKYESMLTGLPQWLISVHTEESEFFQSFIRKRGKKPSLINLSELTRFTLWIDAYSIQYLSDLLFTHTFLRMPKLRTLTLFKYIQPTENMKEEWTAQGRQIRFLAKEDGNYE